jgi:hypothetical protein
MNRDDLSNGAQHDSNGTRAALCPGIEPYLVPHIEDDDVIPISSILELGRMIDRPADRLDNDLETVEPAPVLEG